MTTTTFPEKLVDREKFIFDQVAAGNFAASWSPLEYSIGGRNVKLNVMSDALKIGGVRVTCLQLFSNSLQMFLMHHY